MVPVFARDTATLRRVQAAKNESSFVLSSLAFASDVLLEDSGDLGDTLRILVCAMARRHNFFGSCAVQMRAPIGYDAVAAVGRVSSATIANDRVIGKVLWKWERVHDFHKTVIGRERIDAVWYSFHFHDGWILRRNCRLQYLRTERDQLNGLANDTRCNSADRIFRDDASAMRHRDENDARNLRPAFEDQYFGRQRLGL